MKEHAKHKEVNRFMKYWMGGGVYFWLGYAIFSFCYSLLKLDWFPSKIIADIIGWTSNYILQRFWAFPDRIHLTELKHAGRYISVESVGFILDYLIIWWLKSIGISPYIGFFISSGFFTIYSYIFYKYWVFPDKKKPKKNKKEAS